MAMPQPNKEHIRLLVDALRSGKFRQGRNKLAEYRPAEKRVRYCCLGVACEVAKANGLELLREPVGDGEYSYSTADRMFRNSTILPRVVRDWFGFSHSDPELGIRNIETATFFNDEKRYTLRQIADAFERKYLNDGSDTVPE